MKKSIAILLAVTLLLSLCSIPAMADADDGTIEENGFTFSRPLADGSVAVLKYKYDAEGSVIDIPANCEATGTHVSRIAAHAFDGCRMTGVTIPDTVNMIGMSAFNNCTEIQKIKIPNGVVFIEGNPFTNCTSLVNIDLEPKHPTMQVTTDGALYSRKNKMLICYPCSKNDRSVSVKEGTISIGKYAFSGCDRLEAVSLPATVTEICEGAFFGCTNLTKVTLPESLLTIGELAFTGCSSLMGIRIPQLVSRIEKSTFFGCKSLSTVSFPGNLTNIGERAFYDCRALHEIRLPANVKSIGENAFDGCASLENAYIPVSVTDIGKEAFENCSVKLRLHLEEDAYAEIYAKLYSISFTYGNEDSFLTSGTDGN